MTKRPPLRSHQDRLAGHQRRRAVAHRAPGNEATLDDQLGLYAKKGRTPDDNIRQLSAFERADVFGYPESSRGIDGVFGNVTPDAGVVAEARTIFRQRSALFLHFRCKLPRPANHLVNTAHTLAI